jgi:hypothetical protein
VTPLRPQARRIAAAALCALLVVCAASPARAQGALPLEEQVPIFLKALAYDRNLEARARGDILIGLLYVPGDVRSEATARDVAKLIAASPLKAIGDLPVFYRLIPYDHTGDLSRIIEDEWVDVLYVAPGATAIIDSVLAITAKASVLSVSSEAGYATLGVSLCVGASEGRPEIIVNLSSVTNEGSKFAGQFLNLCTVLRPDPEPRGSLPPQK